MILQPHLAFYFAHLHYWLHSITHLHTLHSLQHFVYSTSLQQFQDAVVVDAVTDAVFVAAAVTAADVIAVSIGVVDVIRAAVFVVEAEYNLYAIGSFEAVDLHFAVVIDLRAELCYWGVGTNFVGTGTRP